MDINLVISLLRNPYGRSEDELRRARLIAAEVLEKLHLSEYRRCVESTDKICSFASINIYGVWCCNLDGLSQVEHYGCTPIGVINNILKM